MYKKQTQIDEVNKKLETLQDEFSIVTNDIYRFDASDYLSEDDFENELNSAYGEVSICGTEYSAGRALKDIDPIAFRCGYSDWCSEYDLESITEYTELIERKEEIENQIYDLESEIQELESEG